MFFRCRSIFISPYESDFSQEEIHINIYVPDFGRLCHTAHIQQRVSHSSHFHKKQPFLTGPVAMFIFLFQQKNKLWSKRRCSSLPGLLPMWKISDKIELSSLEMFAHLKFTAVARNSPFEERSCMNFLSSLFQVVGLILGFRLNCAED